MGEKVAMTTAGALEVINGIKVLATVSRRRPLDDLTGFIEQARREDAFRRTVDPTAWMRTHRRSDVWVEAAEAALAFRRTVERLAVDGRLGG